MSLRLLLVCVASWFAVSCPAVAQTAFVATEGPTALLRSATVRDDLKLGDGQVAKLDAWLTRHLAGSKERVREAMLDAIRGGGAQSGAVERAVAAAREADLTAAGTVLEPAQVKRLREIDLRVSGVVGFGRPELWTALKLTDDQLTAVRAAVNDYGLDAKAADKEGSLRQKQDRAAKLNDAAVTRIKGLLTREQLAEYDRLCGQPIDVPAVRDESRRKPAD